jgi:hypothetical protein
MQCPSIKYPCLSYGNGFFLKLRYYYAFIITNASNTFFESNFIQNFKLKNGLKLNWCISIPFTIQNFIQKFHPQP